MNFRFFSGFVAVGAIALATAPAASASYMEKCEALIAEWDACKETGSACKPQQKALEEQCKCHKQKGDEWKLVMAAVGKDDVCEKDWPTPPPPDPSPPPHDKGDVHIPEKRG